MDEEEAQGRDVNLIGISGKAGSGKDTVGTILVEEYGFLRVALADPLKRIVRQVWPFTEMQLWGPSERREEPPHGYVRPIARAALQLLGTEWGRRLDPDVWINMAVRTMRAVLDEGRRYDPREGLSEAGAASGAVKGVVITDIRFDNEAATIRKAGGQVWCVYRHVPSAGVIGRLAGGIGHASEMGVSPALIDWQLPNDGTFDDLRKRVRAHCAEWRTQGC